MLQGIVASNVGGDIGKGMLTGAVVGGVVSVGASLINIEGAGEQAWASIEQGALRGGIIGAGYGGIGAYKGGKGTDTEIWNAMKKGFGEGLVIGGILGYVDYLEPKSWKESRKIGLKPTTKGSNPKAEPDVTGFDVSETGNVPFGGQTVFKGTYHELYVTHDVEVLSLYGGGRATGSIKEDQIWNAILAMCTIKIPFK